MLDQLAQTNGELAEEVRLLLFTFEDVVKLDDRSIQMVLKEVDQKDLAIALRGVSDDVKHRIFSNMSERGAELLKEEIDFQPPQRRRVIEESQGRIVGVVRRLEEAGAVVISRGCRRRRRRADVDDAPSTSTSRPLAAPAVAADPAAAATRCRRRPLPPRTPRPTPSARSPTPRVWRPAARLRSPSSSRRRRRSRRPRACCGEESVTVAERLELHAVELA